MNFHTDHRLLLAVAGIAFLVLTLLIAVVPAWQSQTTPPLPENCRIRRPVLVDRPTTPSTSLLGRRVLVPRRQRRRPPRGRRDLLQLQRGERSLLRRHLR